MSKRRRIDSLGSRSSRNWNAASMQCSGVCVSMVSRLQVSPCQSDVMAGLAASHTDDDLEFQWIAFAGPFDFDHVCLHRNWFNSVVGDPNTPTNQESCRASCARLQKISQVRLVLGKAVALPRYPIAYTI